LNHLLPEEEQANFTTFADLLEMVAKINPDLRVRFSTSNPRDMTDAVLYVIAKYENLCKYIHLPVQAGSTSMLERMNRGYSREQYIERINSIRRIIPDCAISTDIIAGFCGETEEEHQATLSLMEWVNYDFAYMFKYSERPGTAAAKKMKDDISEEEKSRRLSEIVAMQQKMSAERTKLGLHKTHRVLIEGLSKKSDQMLSGRTSQNLVIVFPKENYKPGEYVNVHADSCTKATLIGHIVK
jgi:tRNA-2-methylthio-N6-dimethylallyladenosine synthase